MTFIEHALAAFDGTGLSGQARLEAVALFSAAVRLIAQTEIEQARAGRDVIRWQGELAGIASAGRHPHLAAALADAQQAAPAGKQDVFDTAMSRLLTGILAP